MITGKKLRTARKKQGVSAESAAKTAGISKGTLYAWEQYPEKPVRPKNTRAFAKLLAVLGLDIPEILEASLPEKPASGGKMKKAVRVNVKGTDIPVFGSHGTLKSVAIPQGVTHAVIVGGEGGGGGDRNGPADVAELTNMLGFFMGDQTRRSNLGRLLKACIRNGLTIHGLERAIDGNG